jgi:hypothetical protein
MVGYGVISEYDVRSVPSEYKIGVKKSTDQPVSYLAVIKDLSEEGGLLRTYVCSV